jgi:ankyrin repeat protein
MQLLIDSGADLNAVRGNGHTALAAAVQQGHRACARWLIRSGASVNTARFDGYTPLHTAARKGDREMVQWLLGAGADHGLVAKVGRWVGGQVWDKCGTSVGLVWDKCGTSVGQVPS